MNKISFILYQIQLNQLNKGKKKCKWLGFVKSTLEKLGLVKSGNHNNSQSWLVVLIYETKTARPAYSRMDA